MQAEENVTGIGLLAWMLTYRVGLFAFQVEQIRTQVRSQVLKEVGIVDFFNHTFKPSFPLQASNVTKAAHMFCKSMLENP